MTEKNPHLWKHCTCHRCGKCCTQLGLPYDARALPGMATFIGVSIDELVHRYYGHRSEDGQALVFQDQKSRRDQQKVGGVLCGEAPFL